MRREGKPRHYVPGAWWIETPRGTVAMCAEECDARLIAAAPAMLDALRALLPPDGDGSGEWWGLSEEEQRDRIRAAIRKATGA